MDNREFSKRKSRVPVIYLFQLSFLLLLFFVLGRLFGYAVLALLLFGQILGIILNNTLPCKENKPLYYLLEFLGGGFYPLVKTFFDLEKKAKISRSTSQVILFFLHTACTLTLFYIWMMGELIYVYISLVGSLLVSLLFLFSKRDKEEKITVTLLIFIMFGYGYLIFLFALPKLYFLRYKRRYSSLEEKPLTKRNAEHQGDPVGYLAEHGFKNIGGAHTVYFPTGKRFFDDLFQKLEAAKEYIYIEFLMFEVGELSDKLFDVLSRKAKEGVRVRIIYDDFATPAAVVQGAFARLSELSAKCIPYNRVFPLPNTFLLYRDHRKSIVIDGIYAYTGGVNVADEYINLNSPFGYWKDVGVRVSKGGAAVFLSEFCRQWFAISGERLGEDAESISSSPADAVAVPYFDRPGNKFIYEVYYRLIESAKESLTVMTPYLIPGDRILRLIEKKAKEGVKVDLIIPDRPDKRYAYVLTKLNAERLSGRGVTVYRMCDAFTHAKVIMTEGLVSVGTANFDSLSFYKCAECGVLTNEGEAMADVFTDIEYVKRASEICTPEYFKERPLVRLASEICRLFSVIM